MAEKTDNSLLSESFNLTMLGVLLTLTITAVERQLTAHHVTSICCFLASAFVWKMVWPIRRTRHICWQIFSVVMICVFGWWLVYQAENTRSGWYRFNVLQKRVQSFVKHAPAYVIISDEEGKITAVSDNIDVLTGYTPKELLGKKITTLMRDAPASKHTEAFNKAVRALRDSSQPNTGWLLQGLLTVGIKSKDGHVVPVKAYAGGIRWSTDIQFKGDIDMFAVFIPVPEEDAMKRPTTITPRTRGVIKEAPPPPPVPMLAPEARPL